MSLSAWLIGNGWRPAPSIHAETVFEHDRLSKIPPAVGKPNGLYVPGHARFPLGIAAIVQAVRERALMDRAEQFRAISERL